MPPIEPTPKARKVTEARISQWLTEQDESVRREELLLALDAVADTGGVGAALDAVLCWTTAHRDDVIRHLAQHGNHYAETRGLYVDARRARSPERRGKPRKRRQRRE